MPVLHAQIVCLTFAARAFKDRLILVNGADVYLITHNPPSTSSFVLLQYAWSVQSSSCHSCRNHWRHTIREDQTLDTSSVALVRASNPNTRSRLGHPTTGSSFELNLRTFNYDCIVVVVLPTHLAFKLIAKPINWICQITIASVIPSAISITYDFVNDVVGFNRMDLSAAFFVSQRRSLLLNTNCIAHDSLLPNDWIAKRSSVLLAHRQALRLRNLFVLVPYPNIP